MRAAKADIVAAITDYRNRGYSKAEIAKRLGLAQSTIGAYVSNFKIPLTKRTKICPHCGVDISAQIA